MANQQNEQQQDPKDPNQKKGFLVPGKEQKAAAEISALLTASEAAVKLLSGKLKSFLPGYLAGYIDKPVGRFVTAQICAIILTNLPAPQAVKFGRLKSALLVYSWNEFTKLFKIEEFIQSLTSNPVIAGFLDTFDPSDPSESEGPTPFSKKKQ